MMRYLILPILAVVCLSSCRNTERSEAPVQPQSADAPAVDPNPDPRPDSAAAADVASNQPPKSKQPMSYNKLNANEAYVILQKGTESRGVGEYTDLEADGTYICRQCNAELYRSKDKFHSGCGWPSFDDEVAGAVDRHEDASLGMTRVEIVCSNCKGHLGHVFHGEGMTQKNTRHCVNSISMRFIKAGEEVPAMIVLPTK